MKKAVSLILMVCIVLAGCQKSPEKSSVASKAEGLSKDVIAKALKEGEKKSLDIPEHWSMSEKKSNDRVTISADLDLGKVEVGNLPVIEMENHELSQKELEKMVSYFAKDEAIYKPQAYTKQVYQKLIDRIDKKEGIYGDTSMWTSYQELESALKSAMDLAPEAYPEPESAEIKFQKKTTDPALLAAQDWAGGKKEENTEGENYFTADVGKERNSYINAERYDSNNENSSSFVWQEGADIIEDADIADFKNQCKYKLDSGMDTTGFVQKYSDLLDQYEACLDQNEDVNESEGKKQAKQVLKDLEISNVEFSSSEQVLWFPKEAFPERDFLGYWTDHLWQGDLSRAEAGYQYTFLNFVEGIPAEQVYGTVSQNTTESYTPPFPVEKITITVMKDGVKSFKWEGMTEEADRIADNTELMPFENIQDLLVEQIFYWYSQGGQPANDPTLFDYKVGSAQLVYTYVPAYGEPKNAWLVPAWVFSVAEYVNGAESSDDISFVLNALDGGVIGRTD